MSAKYKSPSFLLPNELNTSANPANDTGINSLYSMDFDGSSSSITIGSNISIPNEFTVSCWININTIHPHQGYGYILTVSSGAGFAIDEGGGGVGTGKFYFYNGAGTSLAVSTTAISANQWNNVAFVCNKTSNEIKCYINGSLDKTTTVTNLSNFNNPDFIGKHGIAHYINGKLDEIAIFNRALTDGTGGTVNEIAALYGGTSPNIYPSNLIATDLNPIAYYPLGEQAQNSGYLSATGNEWQFPNGVLQDYVMDFDGSTDYIDAGSSAGVIGTDISTFSMWLKTSNTGGQTILSTRNQSTDDGWVVQITSTTVQFFNEKNNKMIYTTLSPTLSNGSWHNVVIIRGGSIATNAIYVDGNPINLTINTEDGTSPQSSSNLSIGSTITSSSTPGFFNGELSNIAIWNSNQSTNIANIYNNGSPQTTYTVTPQNWWKLNADSVYTPSVASYSTALDFDAASSDSVNIFSGSTPSTFQNIGNATSDYSISFWFKTTDPSVFLSANSWYGDDQVIELRGRYDQNNYNVPFNISVASNIRIGRGIGNYTSGGLSGSIVTTKQGLNDDNWHNVVVTVNNNGTPIIYIDNVISTNTGFPSNWSSLIGVDTSVGSGTADLHIGARSRNSGVPTSFFNGSLSNFSIWNTALTSTQISTLFNFGTPETNISFNPTHWWKLDDQTAITDYGSGGINGTNNGATQVSSSVAVTPSWKISSALPIPTINTSSAINIGTAGTNPGPIGLNPYFNFDLSSVTTTSIWIKPPASGSAQQGTILGNNGATGGATVDSTVLLAWRSSSVAPYNKVIETYDYGWLGNKVVSNSFSNDFWYGNWHHILMIRNNQNVSFFVDGVAAGGGTFASSQSTTPVNVNAIGGALGNWYFQDGEISNLAIWNSDQSVNKDNIYNNGQPQSSYTVTPDHLFTLDNLTTGINDVYSSSAGTATSGVTKVDTNVYVGNIPVNGVSTTLPSTALQQSDLQFDSPYSNYSLSFDGSDKVVIPNTSNIFDFGTNDFTVSLWCKGDGVAASQYVIGSTDSSFKIGRHASVPATGKGGARFRIGSSFNTITAVTTNIDDGDWHNVVVKRESGGVSIFTDGQAQQLRLDNGTDVSTPYTMNDSVSVGSNLFIGSYAAGAEFWIGKIDETAFWSVALTSAQILEIYNNGRPKDLSTFSGTAPISWWRLGENAYFDNNSFVVPNSITGAPNGTGAGTITTMISADAPGTYANGIGENLAILDRVGDAPLSTSNSQSYNMIPSDISPYVPGYVGLQTDNIYSMSFNGTDEYFNAGNLSAINGLQKVTYSFWMNDSSGGASYPIGTDGQLILMPLINSDRFDVYLNGTSGSARIYNNQTLTVLNTGQWHHIALVIDSTLSTANQRTKLYIDGNAYADLSGTPISQNATIGTVATDTNIGRASGSAPAYFNGELDEVAIFDKALTADQVNFDLYQPSLPAGSNKTADIAKNPNLPTPVAWYRMGD